MKKSGDALTSVTTTKKTAFACIEAQCKGIYGIPQIWGLCKFWLCPILDYTGSEIAYHPGTPTMKKAIRWMAL
ncbi:MAG: hypothetical protein EOO03_10965 [Chitinophagaceae bacterium]|nr:MAG: hypothetical protein EOO03_10965 [Chitinophagaceae bacterium]